MLTKLSTKDSKWRNFALSICKDKLLADDLVQDMYMYFSDKNKEVKDYYVCRTIYSLFIDHIRNKKKRKESSIEMFFNITDNTRIFEPNDKEQEALDAFSKLKKNQKELLLEHHVSGKSLRNIQKDFPLINYGYAYRQIKEGEQYIKNKTNG